jgi:hypothetical protein
VLEIYIGDIRVGQTKEKTAWLRTSELHRGPPSATSS